MSIVPDAPSGETQDRSDGRFREKALIGTPGQGLFGLPAFTSGRDLIGGRSMPLRLSWGFSKIPYRPQVEYADCGLACLQMTLAARGIDVSLHTLREEVGSGRNGTSAGAILRAARRYGLDGRGVRTNLVGLRHLASGSILFWRFNHFVVLERASRSFLVIVDPAVGRRRISWEQADIEFTGVALEFQPLSGGGGIAGRLRGRSGDIRSIAGFIPRTGRWWTAALLSGILLGFNLAYPVLLGRIVSRGSVDVGVDGALPFYALVITAAIAGYAFLQIWRSRLIVSIQSLLEAGVSRAVMARLLRLPLHFYLSRSPGDLTYRTRSAARLKQVASVTTVGAGFDAMLICGYVILIAFERWWLSIVLFVFAALFVLFVAMTWQRQRELSVDAVESQIKTASVSQEILENMVTVKSLGAEHSLHVKWMNQFAVEISAGTRKRRHAGMITAAMATLQFGAPLAVLLAGLISAKSDTGGLASAVALGSVGIGLFVSLSNISQAMATVVDLLPELSRLNDILGHPEESTSAEVVELRDPPAVAMVDVTYAYPGGAETAVKGTSFSIRGGEFLAILGQSGSGKSTVGMLLAGLLTPSDGAISVAGERLSALNLEFYRSQIGYIDQNSVIMAGSILENIRLGNASATLAEVREAARLAMIDEFICGLPMRYETILGSGGSGISGGQRQRIALARVLVRKPSLLILDEATSAVDPENERSIFENIKTLGATVISIGHREAVARGADVVLRMSDGHGEVVPPVTSARTNSEQGDLRAPRTHR